MKEVNTLRGIIPELTEGVELKKSVCSICDPTTQCGLDVYVKDGEVIRVEGSKDHPKNEGTLCSKGAATRQYVYSPERLETPLKRVGARGSDEFESITWDEALDTIADKLNHVKEDVGPESVVFYTGYSKWYRPFLQRLAHIFGSPNYLTESSTCAVATKIALMLNGTPGAPNFKNSNCLLVWSANPFYSRSCIARDILAAKEKGLKIITVDPRYTPMVAQSDLHLPVKPGTDGALALSMANVIINEGLYDNEFVGKYTVGFEKYKEYAQQFTPEKGEVLTGVAKDKIIAAARLYATTKPASIMQSASAVTHHTNGVQNYRAIFSLIALTGNYDIYGGNVNDPPSFLNQPGGFDSRVGEYIHPRPWDEMATRIGHERFPVWMELVDEGQAMHLPSQIRSQEPYPIKALLAFGLNYRMWPDSEGFLRSLSDLDFIANVDIFMTDSCRYADIVLPACTSIERSELRCYSNRYIIFTDPAIVPLHESRSDADIIFELSNRLGLNDPLFQAGYEASLDWILEPSGMTIEELKKHPGGMKVPNAKKPIEKKYVKKGFKTPSGKMEFTSLVLEKHGYDSLPTYSPPRYSKEETPELAEQFPLTLNTGSRLPMFVHSRTFRLPWTRSLRPEPAADINPSDASKLHIEQGDKIKISTPNGSSITTKANLTNMVRSGVVHMYHAYKEADVNVLFEADYLDPISGFPGFKSMLCRVDKV